MVTYDGRAKIPSSKRKSANKSYGILTINLCTLINKIISQVCLLFILFNDTVWHF